MKLTEPFELSCYVVRNGALFSPNAVLGIETLRHDASGLYYADMNATLSTAGNYMVKNPIAYKTLQFTPKEKLEYNEHPVLEALGVGAVYNSPKGVFIIRKDDGVFVYDPDFVCGGGLYPAPYFSMLDTRARMYSANYHTFGRYQIGTQEYVIKTLIEKMEGRPWFRAMLFSEMKKILDARKIENINGR